MNIKLLNRKILILFLLFAMVFSLLQPFSVPKIAHSEVDTTDKVWLLDGASIKMSTKDLRLRFYGCVDYDYYNSATDIQVGVILTATNYLERVEEFTFEALDNAGLLVVAITAESFMNESTAKDEGYYLFHCDLTDIVPQNLDREFVARPYVRYRENPRSKEYVYIYGSFDKLKNSRSVYGLVQYWLDNSTDFATSQIAVLKTLLYSVNQKNADRMERAEDHVTFYFEDLNRGVIKLNGNLSSYGAMTVQIDGKTVVPLSTVYYDISRYHVGKVFSVRFEKNEQGVLPEKFNITYYREYRIL